MPTYEYECKSCSFSFEAFQSMKDDPLNDCPECGKEVRRLINGGAGVIFKGSGFYVTDKSKSSKPDTKSSADNSSAKTDTKPDVSAAPSPCSTCPNKGASSSCPA